MRMNMHAQTIQAAKHLLDGVSNQRFRCAIVRIVRAHELLANAGDAEVRAEILNSQLDYGLIADALRESELPVSEANINISIQVAVAMLRKNGLIIDRKDAT